MSGTSAIEWTEATWNPVTGCSHVSDGCTGDLHAEPCPYRPAFFFKQWGSWAPVAPFDSQPGDRTITYADVAADMRYRGASPKSGGRLLDGRTWDELPQRQAVAA